MATQPISKTQLDTLRKLGLPEVKENNQWLVLHVKGDGVRAPKLWNAKVYTNGAGNMKVVTTDMATLVALLSEPPRMALPEPGRIISIDDSGWGFPLLGVIIGVHDSQTGQILTDEIPVEYFQPPKFQEKRYLICASNIAMLMLDRLGACPGEDGLLVKVCTGYVNSDIVQTLGEVGFKVQSCKIGEPLQSALEAAHRKYILENTMTDLYYDPKELSQKEIPQKFYEVIGWIKANNAWDIAKTGWGFFQTARIP